MTDQSQPDRPDGDGQPAPDAMRDTLDRLDVFARESRAFGYVRDNDAIYKFLAAARAALSAPVPSPDGAGELYFEPSGDGMGACIHDANGAIICEAKYDDFESDPSYPERVMKRLVALSPSGAGAAEPVGWLWHSQDNLEWQYSHGPKEPECWKVRQPVFAVPPVRGDREVIERAIFEALPQQGDDKVPWSWDDTLSLANKNLGVDTKMAKLQIAEVRKIADAILSLPSTPVSDDKSIARALPSILLDINAVHWSALRLVIEWWDGLPPNLRQDIEGSDKEPGAIAAARTALPYATPVSGRDAVIEWTAIEDEMPPSHKNLLFKCNNGDIYQGRMCYGMHSPWFCGHSELNFGVVISDKQQVTHWMLASALSNHKESGR